METQESVVAWARKAYPGETPKDKVRALIEEACELTVATGQLSFEEAMEIAKGVWEELKNAPQSPAHVASGLADVQIMLYAIASDHGLDVHACTDGKMEKNRLRTGG